MNKKQEMIEIINNSTTAREIINEALTATYRQLFTENQITGMKCAYANEMLQDEPDEDFMLYSISNLVRAFLI